MRSKLSVLLSLIAAPAFVQSGLGQTAFPDITNLSEVTMSLRRADGMGGGPSYQLVISGDGAVRYEGYANVFIRGKRIGHISRSAVKTLIEEFRNARFFELHDYESAATDLPGRVTQFQVGATIKRVDDYGLSPSLPGVPDGFSSGAPKRLIELENRIDEIVNSRRWVKGPLFRRLLHWH
jgi:uncharacterized protein DUF6438